MTENAKGQRAEDTLPPTFHPSPLAGDILRDPEMRRTQLEYIAGGLGEIRLSGDLLAGPIEDEGTRLALAAQIGKEATRLQRLVKALAVGALAAMVLTVGLAAGPAAGRAEAMEAPQPDPTRTAQFVQPPAYMLAQTVRVVLGAAPVTVYVRATVYTETAPGWWCASVWTARGRVGGTCSIASSFPVPVTIDPRMWPVGRTFGQVVDDATDVAVGDVTFDARRPSRFGVGTYLDLGRGDLSVRVPVTLYSPTAGRWVPQVASPVQVQELTRRGWRVRATLWTSPPGVAAGLVHLGGGRHIIRAVRADGSTVWGTTGQNRLVVVTTEPLDID